MCPNVEGNRRADEMRTEDQAVCRRVRLTVRLGPSSNRLEKEKLIIAEIEVLDVPTGHKAAPLKQALGGDVRSVSRNVKLCPGTATLQLRQQLLSDTEAATPHPDNE